MAEVTWQYGLKDLTVENDGDPWFEVVEQYYNEQGELLDTAEIRVCGPNKDSIIWQLNRILKDLEQ